MRVTLPRKIILVVVSSLLTLLVMEVGFRIILKARGRDLREYQPSTAYNLAHADKSRFVSHPFLPYAARPNDSRSLHIYREETKRAYDYQYSLNSLGFRTPERAFKKPEGVIRIVTLGGSTTIDGFTNSETWPARLESRLNARYQSRGVTVEVINLGLDMASSPMSLLNLELMGLDYNPNLVISYDGVNDSWLIGHENITPDYRNVYRNFDDNYRSWQSLVPSWAFRSYLVTMFTFALDRGGRGGSDIGSQVMRHADLKQSSNPPEGITLFERNLKLTACVSLGKSMFNLLHR